VKLRRRLLAMGVVAGLATVGALVALQLPATAHGAAQIPGSRTWLCYEDGLTSTGQIIPNNPACAAAVAQSGTNSLYNWFAVGNRNGATSGMMQGFIPDGKLCSGDSNYYDFSGFDLARNDWPETHLTAGATIQIQYNKWAAHPGTFRLYVTKQGWNDTAPLSWDEMNLTPFSSSTDPPSVGNPGTTSSYYYWNATLPTGLTGHHIIYSVWARSDSTETFYGCSDVVFDGGSGQVTGVGPGGSTGSPTPTASATRTNSPTPTASATRTSSPTPTGTGGGTAGCSATYTVSSSWSGGFQGNVTVKAGSAAIHSWKVSWTFGGNETITQIWNGTLSSAGSLQTVTNVSYNGALSAGGTTSFGFLANGTASQVSNVSCSAT
jgi:predicted carbohydrate-binding protein with CBM5 and CBM33 domain